MRLQLCCVIPAVVFVCSLTSGCGSRTDVSRDAACLGPMAIGQVYTLRRGELLCRSNKTRDAVRDWLLPEGSEGTVEHPPPRTDFGRTWLPEAVRDVIPAGTRL